MPLKHILFMKNLYREPQKTLAHKKGGLRTHCIQIMRLRSVPQYSVPKTREMKKKLVAKGERKRLYIRT